MPLENLKDQLKTTSATAPASLAGVRSLHRLAAAGNPTGNATASDTDVTARSQGFAIKAQEHLYGLQKRASELQLASERGNMAVEAGMAEDQSNIKHKQFDQSQGDALDEFGRKAAGVVAIGKAATKITRNLGLDGLHNVLKNIPLIGVSKESQRVNDLYDQSIKAHENGDLKSAERLAATARLYVENAKQSFLTLTPYLFDRPREAVEAMYPDTELRAGYTVAVNRYAEIMGKELDIEPLPELGNYLDAYGYVNRQGTSGYRR
jgi:hypothetical protein